MSDLIAQLKSNDPSVVCAAVDALETVDLEGLKANIVSLLLNSNVWVRSRAARAMCRWDRTEAIRYLAAMLFSKNKTERDAALNHSLFFPFNQIEAILIKYLTVENEPDLIQKAGLVFMANPDKVTASHLYEAQQATRGLRSDLINGILMGVLDSLYKAKLEADAPIKQFKKIKLDYDNKRIKIYISHFSALLSSEEPEIRMKAAIKLCELIRQKIADVSNLIKDFLKKEKNEEVTKKVKEYLKTFSIDIPLEEAKIGTDTPEQRKILYSSITNDNYSKMIPPLLPDIKKYDSSEQMVILKLIEDYGSKLDSEYVVKCLDSKDSSVLQAAIETLSKIDLEILQSYLPEFIKSESDSVKVSAINAYALSDKTQALCILDRMMNSVKLSQRKNALFCLENLDFASASDIYLSALKREKNEEIRAELMSVLYDNANEEVFCEVYFQFNAKRNEDTDLKPFLERISKKLASENPNKKSDDYWNLAEARLLEEKCMVKQRELYRLERVQCLREDNSEEKTELIKFAITCHSIGFILTLLIWFGFMAPSAWFISDNNSKKKHKVSLNQEFGFTDDYSKEKFKTEYLNVRGKIEDVNVQNRQAMLLDYSGRKYLLIFHEGQAIPQPGLDFCAQVYLEDYSDSVYTAEVINIF